MKKFAKWIGGGLGWVLGGPIGGIIGFVLGSFLDSGELNTVTTGSAGPHSGRQTAEGDFKMSLLVLIACIMRADGNPKKSELDVVKRFLIVNFGEQGALEALSILKELLKQPINETEVAMQINRYMNYSSKLELLHLLFEIANADGKICNAELNMLQRIARTFGISTLDFDSIRAPFFKTQDHNWAYKVLEIESTASVDDIKKAYRRMAMKYHPDKVNNLGEEVKKAATEKFRSVNEAYESLKTQRNFS